MGSKGAVQTLKSNRFIEKNMGILLLFLLVLIFWAVF